LTQCWVPHDTRDHLVDFVNAWAGKTEIPVCRLLGWIGLGASKFHDWKHRYGKVNEHNAWIPRDHWLTQDEKRRITDFANSNPLEGYRRLTFMMLDRDVVACSPTSVWRVLHDAGLLAKVNGTPSKKGTGFVQPLQPHQHWHVDVSYLNIAGTFYFLCSVLDGFSRFIVHWEIRETMKEGEVETIIQRARECHPGVTPRIISDNGPQFIAKDFKEFVRVCGMTHVKTSPYYPQSNGKIERFHRTLKGDCIRSQTPLSLEDARRIVGNYVARYNTVRLHSAIGYITPKDKLEGRAEEIFTARDRKLAEARECRRLLRQAEHDQATNAAATRPAIDFAAIKATITLAEVLALLQFEPRSVRGAQQRGPCPLHGSSRGRSFCVNLADQCFHCFKCHAHGNALDLWAAATHQRDIYAAAVDLCERLGRPVPLLNQANREEEPVASAAVFTTTASQGVTDSPSLTR
jgi:putative transposase